MNEPIGIFRYFFTADNAKDTRIAIDVPFTQADIDDPWEGDDRLEDEAFGKLQKLFPTPAWHDWRIETYEELPWTN